MNTLDPTIRFSLQGEIDLQTFTVAVNGLKDLVNALANDLTPTATISWELDDLAVGSAAVAVRAVAGSAAASNTVVRAYDEIGAAIADNQPLAYSDKISRSAGKLARLVERSRVECVQFETDHGVHTVTALGPVADEPLPQTTALGSVTGWIESLSRRGDLHLTLIDDVFGNRVSLHLRKGQEELGCDAWDLHATVSGIVSHEHRTGRPTDVRDISSIEPVRKYPPGAWRTARGAIPWKPGDPPAEEIIRRIRDRA